MAIPAPRPGAVALITGASSGIGTELARGLVAIGHDAILVARRRERLESLARELRRGGRRIEVIAADVSDPTGRATLLTEIRGLRLEVDVLVPCAGFGMGGAFIDADPERIQQLIRTNVEGSLLLVRSLAPAMVERRSGAILLVSSMAGNQPMPHFQAYAATKAAVTSLAESLDWELGRSGVTVTALCPGGVRTELAEVAGMLAAESRTPKAFMADPARIADAALKGRDRNRRTIATSAAADEKSRSRRLTRPDVP
ncbi:short-chain dehydrogenase [Mycobacterium florentinum]|uniref:Short-chain dehydrogenase n=1 Tax=Mycobacterium florentinum TaxID=292462 RepID=A0A1X1TWK6_MYCFL|nr:SDR family NAD(P)-dependent oxidoreductase [Mycobacterium florentinum]MCV7408102.1 SDR family NAD(P)-dependent oxidoreductase [Mycobacterium florentinum]ORV48788.1 short-chain dehydrogenase [Mycobacterium florentinum]BBX77121.1 ketoacyl reductase [Mycobacterium florentinum]